MADLHGYEAVIGLEVHAQLTTQSKIFCGCEVTYGDEPNTHTCPVCLGLPGALPVLNQKAVECAVRTISAVGGRVNNRSAFARKNYFYPDLPKGYQISQYDRPIGEGGEVAFRLDDGDERVCRLKRIHLEEDAGKLVHSEEDEATSKVDLNRCGSPLMEIVTEADLETPDEAYGYLRSLKQTLQYLSVCTGDMEKGHLRCDANVSVRPKGQDSFGTRTELKNLNSFKGVKRALEYEIDRQISVLNSGGEIAQETLLWDEDRQVAEPMRSKEESEDYRYFREPDLVNLLVSESWADRLRHTLPELPEARTVRFTLQYGLKRGDAEILTAGKALADYYEKAARHFDDPGMIANWVLTEVLGVLKDKGTEISDLKVTPEMLADLLRRITKSEISTRAGKAVFAEMCRTGEESSAIIAKKGLAQISDESILGSVISEVLSADPDSVNKYRSGNTRVFEHFVGQVMKATGGRANPRIVNVLLKKELEG